MKKTAIAFFCFLIGIQLHAQSEDSLTISLSGYVDAYYSAFNDALSLNEFQQYTTVSPRDNAIGLNIGSIGIHVASDQFRVNAVLHAGDIPAATWSEDFPMIQVANVGVKLTDRLWLDAGFFTTHVGTESFLPKENLLSSTAVATYNEPFYQAGAKLSYDTESDWHVELWALNGYNQFLDRNRAKSLGLLISKDFSENTSISYSSIFGNEQEDQSTLKQFRAYQNIYFNTSSKDWELIVGGDLGMQTNTKNGDETAVMYNALLTLRYSINEQLSITGRGELFKDPVGFISGEIEFPNQITKGLEVYGLTFGSAYKPSSNSYIRVEARMLNELDGQALFNNSNNPASRVEVMLTLGAFINEWEIWRKRK